MSGLTCISCMFRRATRRFAIPLALIFTIGSLYVMFQPMRSGHTQNKNIGKKSGTVLRTARVSGSLLVDSTDYVDESFGECKRPKMDLWHPSMKQHFASPAPLHCDEAPENWVYVENSTFRISARASEIHGKILCEYRPLIRISDSKEKLGDPIRPFSNGTAIQSDFFEARCISFKGEVYKNLHSAIKPLDHVKQRSKDVHLPENAMGLNVLMFGFDSVSRLNWMRNLPKSHEYFTNEMNGITLEGYNIVGDGTPQALLPILTGKTEEELPEARRGFAGANYVDDHPWIWDDLKKIGYATQWGEDGALVGTFQYRMLGFNREPVDHYLRPFQHLVESEYYQHNHKFCLGSVPRVKVMLNWVKAFFDAYPNNPKFSFLFHSEFSHDAFSQLSLADDDLKEFLIGMKQLGYLNNTLLILMADHGARFVNVRQTQQGKYEERLPYFSLRVPEWFETRYPKAMKNLRNNAKMVTSPFDIHETFNDIISYSDHGDVQKTTRGVSLFQSISVNRTCRSAGIEPHWCTCMDWLETSLTDKSVISAAHSLVKSINEITNHEHRECAPLSLETIDAAMKFTPKDKVLKFKQSRDDHGRTGDFTDNMSATSELFQVSITTKPGGGKFEATVTHEMFNGSVFSVDMKGISRINKYGGHPHCVAETFPHLRPYCYCKVQLEPRATIIRQSKT